MNMYVFTLFPEYFESLLSASILGRAIKQKYVSVTLVNIRDFATDKHQMTDDRPYGGGPGMVMKIEPIDLALQHHGFKKGTPWEKIILTSAKGNAFTQSTARTWQSLTRLALICGHYEGVDERVADFLVDEEIRVGDYVLTGGEPAAAVMIDSLTRLIPGVLGNDASNKGESHDIPGQFGHPQYTRPEEYKGWKVPTELLTGDHKKIEEWRRRRRQ